MFTVNESVKILQEKLQAAGKTFPELCIVLGSGWNHVLKKVNSELELSYKDLFGVEASVPGHDGKLVIGTLDGKKIALMAGRLHTYEGHTTEESTRPLQSFAQVGLKKVILTAAAGALNEKYHVGDFVIMSDMITAFCQSPLVGPKFTDLSEVFDPEFRQFATEACLTSKAKFHDGVYCYVRGPHFETPADKMLYRHLGADAVGMSTVHEAIMSRYVGVRVLGLAFITNLAFVSHAHEDVLHAANEGGSQMTSVLQQLVASMA